MLFKFLPSPKCTHDDFRLFWRGLFFGVFFVSGLALNQAHAAKPVKPLLDVTESQAISFGMTAGSSDGPSTFVLAPNGTLTATGYGIVIKGRVREGEFKVRGTAGASVLITLPTTASLSNGGATVTLSNFTSVPSGVGLLDHKGQLIIKVGATLSLPAGHPGGEYSGTFPVFVDLQ